MQQEYVTIASTRTLGHLQLVTQFVSQQEQRNEYNIYPVAVDGEDGILLPREVFIVRLRARQLYYHQPGDNTFRSGQTIH